MADILRYKGYMAKVHYSVEDRVLYGRIEGINDLVTFESEDSKKIEAEFQESVDDYLQTCTDIGKAPDKAYNGSFNIRIGSSKHKAMSELAFKHCTTLNQEIENAVTAYLNTHEWSDNALQSAYANVQAQPQYMSVLPWSNTYTLN